MANGKNSEDIGDDWAMGKPIAPRSGSGSGSFRSGTVESAAPKSHHRPQSSWDEHDDDWGGDEENWRPGPAKSFPSNVRGTGATPPRHPALTKGVSPARPAKGIRRLTRSRAACRRLGVLACLVAAAVTLRSFGVFEGGDGRGGTIEAWETRSSDASDVFERTARSVEDVSLRDERDVPSARAAGERFGSRENAPDAPATRERSIPDRETRVVREAPVATVETMDAKATESPRRVADELARLRASHEHVSNAADATSAEGERVAAFPAPEEPSSAERDVSASGVGSASDSASDSASSASDFVETERGSVSIEDDSNDARSRAFADQNVRQASDDAAGRDDDGDDDELARLRASHEHVSNAADATSAEGERVAAFPAPEEPSSAERDVSASGVGSASDSASDSASSASDFVETERGSVSIEDDSNDARSRAFADQNVRQASDDAAGRDDDGDDDDDDDASVVFGEVLDAALVRDRKENADDDATDDDASVVDDRTDDAAGATSSVSIFYADDDADGGADANDDAEAEEDVPAEAFVTFGATLEAASMNDADVTRIDSRDEAPPEEGDDRSGEDASSARAETAEKDVGAGADVSTNAPPPPPPVPMDGPDMTDPANRARLDAYQSREAYVAWSKKAAKIEGRTVAPPSRARRR